MKIKKERRQQHTIKKGKSNEMKKEINTEKIN
jgi:hypothetical protein